MFTKKSRYSNQPVVTAKDAHGEAVTAVKWRLAGTPPGRSAMVSHGDQLDVISQKRFGDATRYWHIADANSELEANSLTLEPGRRIRTPEKD